MQESNKSTYQVLVHHHPRKDPKGSSIQLIRNGPRAVDVKRAERAEKKAKKSESMDVRIKEFGATEVI